LRFFAFFMIRPIRIQSVQIGPQSVWWQAGGIGFLHLFRCRTSST
jgi:hypothetical protein